VDGRGIIACESRGSQREWYEYGTNGARLGAFLSQADLFAQPVGFVGLYDGADTLNVAFWGENGNPTIVPFGPAAAAVLGPAVGGGAIAFSTSSGTLTVRKLDPEGNEVSKATLSTAAIPVGGSEDAGKAVLALTATGTALSGIWIDLSNGSASAPFSVGNGVTAVARPLLSGGVAVQVDGRWVGMAQPGDVTMRLAPSWLADATDFVPVRGGKGYGLMRRDGNRVDVVSPQGDACGSVTFPGVSAVVVGIEGTAVGSTGPSGCTKLIWRNLLR
jgi:hypothetical protein